MGGWPSRVQALGSNAKCTCHGTRLADLSGEHQVEGEDGLMLSGTWTDGKFGFKGKWVWQDNVYKGGFKEGYFFGRGKFKWSTGESLLADFDTDCPSRGLLRTASGMRKVTFDGLTPLFSSSKPHTLLPFERFSE